jgi:hypothetical protein
MCIRTDRARDADSPAARQLISGAAVVNITTGPNSIARLHSFDVEDNHDR